LVGACPEQGDESEVLALPPVPDPELAEPLPDDPETAPEPDDPDAAPEDPKPFVFGLVTTLQKVAVISSRQITPVVGLCDIGKAVEFDVDEVVGFCPVMPCAARDAAFCPAVSDDLSVVTCAVTWAVTCAVADNSHDSTKANNAVHFMPVHFTSEARSSVTPACQALPHEANPLNSRAFRRLHQSDKRPLI